MLKDFEIIGWPEIQELMDLAGFRENSSLLTTNNDLGIGSSTYLVSREWLFKYGWLPKVTHKKSGEEYEVLTNEAMIKINGEWERNYVLYSPLHRNVDGNYFIRTTEDFEEHFE